MANNIGIPIRAVLCQLLLPNIVAFFAESYIFTARPHCSQVAVLLARGILSVCLSVTFRGRWTCC